MLVCYPDGECRLVVETFAHSLGIIYAEPYWLELEHPAAYLLIGDIKGEGPWKVADVIVRLLSCGDTEFKMQWIEWEQYLASCDSESDYFNDLLKRKLINNMLFSD